MSRAESDREKKTSKSTSRTTDGLEKLVGPGGDCRWLAADRHMNGGQKLSTRQGINHSDHPMSLLMISANGNAVIF